MFTSADKIFKANINMFKKLKEIMFQERKEGVVLVDSVRGSTGLPGKCQKKLSMYCKSLYKTLGNVNESIVTKGRSVVACVCQGWEGS